MGAPTIPKCKGKIPFNKNWLWKRNNAVHCRACGHVFCSKCCSSRNDVIMSDDQWHKTCGDCYRMIQYFNKVEERCDYLSRRHGLKKEGAERLDNWVVRLNAVNKDSREWVAEIKRIYDPLRQAIKQKFG